MIKKAIIDFINTNPGRNYMSLEEIIKKILNELVNEGVVELGEDYILSGAALEIRVAQYFREIGYEIKKGRANLEDFILYPLDNFETKQPIVVEVKSGKDVSLSRENLRQLDDWVFDLSGEEEARKEGLGGGFDAVALATDGLMTEILHHPNPHKGLIIYNGPISLEFARRPVEWLGYNEQEFANKRNFCVLSFGNFINKVENIRSGKENKENLWELIHKTLGELK